MISVCARDWPPRAGSQGEKASTYLLVELVDIVVGLVLGLDEGGVLLDFLGSGHLTRSEQE